MSICIVTTTHSRPRSFNLLVQWLAAQTARASISKWLIVSDGDLTGYDLSPARNMNFEIIDRREERVLLRDYKGHFIPPLPKDCSLVANWKAALPTCKEYDKVIICEDDEFYAATYIEHMSRMLDEVSIAGISHSIYYKLPLQRWQRMYNTDHAALSATGFVVKDVMPLFERVLSCNDIFIDLILWKAAQSQELLGLEPISSRLSQNLAKDGKPYFVAFKCMPGATGLGMGHNAQGVPDINYHLLRQMLPPVAFREYQQLAIETRKSFGC